MRSAHSTTIYGTINLMVEMTWLHPGA